MSETCDLLVVGSGAAGLSAAVTAAFHGLRVIVAEKEPVFGGTTAWSGGWMWVPRNPLATRAGIVEDKETIRTYLRHELGNHYDGARVEAFLDAGPEMVGFFEQNTALRFIDGNKVPDMHGRSPGAGTGGRSVCAAPFDGRALGPLAATLRPPLPEMSLFGMGIASGADLGHFLNATRSVRSFVHVGRRVARHLRDLVLHRRGTQLVNGNALAGRLGKSAADLGVAIRVNAPVRRLLTENGRVVGAVIGAADGTETEIRARCGVVLAAGGFPHDTARKRAAFPHAPTGREHWSAAPRGNTGDGIRLGETAGGVFDDTLAASGAWAPVSLVPRDDGTVAHFPHLIDRAKPGFIAVTKNGRRFVDEALSYYDFVSALVAACPPGEAACWAICDRRFLRRYGLGAVKPAPVPIGGHIRSGYLKTGRTLAELARECGIDAAGLTATVAAYNEAARTGTDPEFGRGGTPFERVAGDAAQQPNPNVAPVEQGPFYAMKIVPGSLGTFAGLRVDASARVLGQDGAPVPGLYAVGTDAASVMGGYYPAGGINLGPAMTFGYLAGLSAAGIARPLPAPCAEQEALA